MIDCRTIKSFITKSFEVELFQDDNGRYRIRYECRGKPYFSEWITDYGMASFMFDLKIQELEGC